MTETAVPEEELGRVTFKDLPAKEFVIEGANVEYELFGSCPVNSIFNIILADNCNH